MIEINTMLIAAEDALCSNTLPHFYGDLYLSCLMNE